MHLGDFNPGDVIDLKFTTSQNGAPTTLGGTPAVSVYKTNSTTESTTGVTLTTDFDARTGLNHVRITTASDGTFYAAGGEFEVVITTGTIGGISVVGMVVAAFSLQNKSALRPTTSGRTLDVSAGGEAGLDWANIGSPTTAQTLSSTTISSSQVAASVTGNVGGNVTGSVGSVTGAVGSVTGNVGGNVVGSVASVSGNVGGNVTGSVGSVASGGITRASLAADTGLQSARSSTAQAGAAGTITLDASASATDNFYNGCLVAITGGTGVGQARVISGYVGSTKVATVTPNWATNPDNTSTFAVLPRDEAKVDSSLQVTAASVQGNVTGSVASVTGAVGSVTGAVGSVTGNVGGNVVGSVASVTAGVTVTTNNDKTGYALTSAYDPAKTAAQAGDVMKVSSGTGANQVSLSSGQVTVGTNNDKTGYGLSAAAVQAIWDALTSALTTVGSIGKLLVTNIDAAISSRLASASYTAPLDAAGTRSAVGLASANLDTQLSTIAGYVDTEVAAIKAKTDNLPASPAAVSDIPTANQNADALLDRASGIEASVTLRQALRLVLAASAGKLSGAATATVIIRDVNDTKNRITATVDSNGNRSAVTTDVS